MLDGLENWVAATAMLSKREADTRIADLIFGQTRKKSKTARKRYLKGKLNNLQEASRLLVEVGMASLSEEEELIPDRYLAAQALKDDAAQALGVYYIDGIMRSVTSGMKDGTVIRAQVSSWINLIVSDPPKRLDDLLEPAAFVKKQNALYKLSSQSDRGAAQPDVSDLTRDDEENVDNTLSRSRNSRPAYPFSNVPFTAYWADFETVYDPKPGGNGQLADIPFYYHGSSRSPLVTPDVIESYAQIAGNGYPDDIAESVTLTLFGLFNVMNTDPVLQDQDIEHEPEVFIRWHQAELCFIRYSPRLVERTLYHDNEKVVYRRTSGKSFPGKLRSFVDADPTDRERPRQERAARSKPYENIKDLPVGITLDSILKATTREEVIGPGGLLSDGESRRFLQRMGDFITRGVRQSPQL
jgi:hypothetical protein